MNRLPLVSLAACALLSDRALAETHEVPQQHATIQAAVDAANDGDTILIHGGMYEEAVLITGKSNLLVQGKGKVTIDPPGDAVALTLDGCTDCTVEKIRTRDAITGIKLLACTGGSLLQCRAEDMTDVGIALGGCDGVTLEKCIVKDCAEDGIGFGQAGLDPSDNCSLIKNKVFGAGDDGIAIAGSGNSIENCLAVEAGGNGYRTEVDPPSTGNAFTHDKCIKSQKSGYEIAGTDNVLTDCSDVQSTVNGVTMFTGSGTVVSGLHSTKPGGAGIGVVAVVSGVSISGCKVTKPLGNGISVIGDTPTVQDNKIAKATVHGFVIGGDGGIWSGNLAKGSGVNGFLLTGSNNTLTNNTAKGSKTGFDLNDTSDGSNSVDASNHFKTKSP